MGNKKKKRKSASGQGSCNRQGKDDSTKRDKSSISLSERECVETTDVQGKRLTEALDAINKSELNATDTINELGTDFAHGLKDETHAGKKNLQDHGRQEVEKLSAHTERCSQSLERKRKTEGNILKMEALTLKEDLQKSAKKGDRQIAIKSNITQVGNFNKIAMDTKDSDHSTESSSSSSTDEVFNKNWPSLPPSKTETGARPKVPNRGSWEGGPVVSINADIVQCGDGQNIIHTNRLSGQTTGNAPERSQQQTSTVHVVVRNQPAQPQPRQALEMEKIKTFLRNVNEGHFILIADEVDFVAGIDALGLIKWTAVIDFDPKGWQTGLLSRLRKRIEESVCLDYISWQEVKVACSHQSVTWIAMMGISNQPDTIVDMVFKQWKRDVMKSLIQRINIIKQFAAQYTDLKVLVLWPNDSSKVKHFKEVIDRLCDAIDDLKVCVVVQEKEILTQDESSILSLLENEDSNEITIARLQIQNVCHILQSECTSRNISPESDFQLPTSDGTNIPDISKKEAHWLQKDLDVLYVDNKTGKEFTAPELHEEEHNFYKGGTLPWSVWYALPNGNFVIERDFKRRLVQFIKTRHFKPCKSGLIHLCHNPGSGGTTLAQSVVWELRQELPCVHIKHRFGSEVIKEVTEKIQFVHDKTHLPVLVLIDGEEKQRVESMFVTVRNYACVIMLYVQRYYTRLSKDDDNDHDMFWLKNVVSKREATQLQYQYEKQCEDPTQKRRLRELTEKIRQKEEHSIFEFGLAVHSFNFTGISTYVSGYLHVGSSQTELSDWQNALCYLSLVYYFGQSSLPCYFFTDLLEGKEIILTKSDFPEEMQELIVKDENEIKPNMVRISHYFVAKEILNQLLPFPKKTVSSPSPNLTELAKKKLGRFAVDFIEIAGKKTNDQSSNMALIMTKTFISRNNKVGSENETLGQKRRKPRVSPILEQASTNPPYTERFDILNQLTASFPTEPQFRAHLGRLYSICRPNEDTIAEEHLRAALIMSKEAVDDLEEEEIPHVNKLDLMHIYHMYGSMILQKVAKKTGKFFGETPRCHDFKTDAASLVLEVKRACDFFNQCRRITPIGCEKSFGYVNEIQIRLMFCNFVQVNSCYANLFEFINDEESESSDFVQESCIELDELFVECYSVIDPEMMDESIGFCQEWYSLLFQNMPGHVLPDSCDGVKTRKLRIARIKMKYCTKENYGILETINSKKDILEIAENLKKNLDEYDKQETRSVSKRQMDLDYKEWIYIIRHDLFEQELAIDKVLQIVEVWYEKVKSPISRFYLFVLKSALGFGSRYAQGNTQLLQEAKCLKEDVLKFSKFVTKPKYPREWLGLPQDNIRRLFPGLRFFGLIQDRDIQEHDLEIRKGRIAFPNNKPSGGYIDLDLGPDNRCPIKVFFIPARADHQRGMVGSKNAGDRVEFVLGFSLSHGYEAFNVLPLKLVTCPNCKIDVEKISRVRKPTCPRCRAIVHTKISKQER
ncbi:uncharacterized protein LOC128212225 [Mya arenaria]|uniref:uncharacterized protein LOC128212225 n=1 Tax=Mya arenaria TaxID=6604 RepID=UPI0022E0F5F2|nr:uncharacterized protein LOC128212225 [Mya arenaria]